MNPEVVQKAKDEFKERTGGKPYKCAMPDGFKPPFHQMSNK